MLKIIKECGLKHGKSVSVYRNLSRKCFSIRDKKTGLVVAYADGFRIENAKCKVYESGRHRVLKNKQKNVHAMIDGIYTGNCQ